MSKLLQPKSIQVITQSGEEKTYLISKFPAIAGREIIAKYPLSALPQVGNYGTNEETMLKLMSFVAIPTSADPIRLATADLVNNHVPDWETLMAIEGKMLEYNCSFFTNRGAVHGFIDLLLDRATPFLSKILTTSLQLLSQAGEQASSNSETK